MFAVFFQNRCSKININGIYSMERKFIDLILKIKMLFLQIVSTNEYD